MGESDQINLGVSDKFGTSFSCSDIYFLEVNRIFEMNENLKCS